jgi:3-oxoacyl-[acyl-carrier-protein] synthase II
MKAYIRGTGNISPQPTIEPGAFPKEIRTFNSAYLAALEPDYKSHIKPIQLRRMSRVLKMGVMAAGTALQEAGIEVPDAIITATGLGMLEETEKFLNSMIDNQERLLNPTAFIQSTHNTVGAHIAVMLSCNHYNLTYVHGPVSFEAALLDTMMWLDEHPGHRVLLGGAEELTDMHFRITDSAAYWKKGEIDSTRLLEYGTPGTIAGEGAAFFLVSSLQEGASTAINGVRTLYKPESREILRQHIHRFLEEAGMRMEDVDLVLMGCNGDSRYDRIYGELEASVFSGKVTAYFKHLCGEHYLASSFALWLADRIIKDGSVPDAILLHGKPSHSPRNILIYNQNNLVHHSLMLVSQC